ncbi:MAG: M23 family metallopeptidase, partial [Candidatus Krumholzibacteria bacterium]|nr:M23 family metallopeptidase [Candidatus Krumholzibacteria bacterium]
SNPLAPTIQIMINISSYPAHLTMIAAILIMTAGCSPAPKYHGHPRAKNKSEPVHEIQSRKKPPSKPVAFSYPVKKFDLERITSFFGIRKHPRYNTREFHRGIDIKAEYGEQAFASACGTVIFAGRQSGFGNVVIIDHGHRFSTVYAHLWVLEVDKGAQVKTGDVIGKIGRTGNATGTHLHFEIRVEGEAVDPLDYL